MKTISINGLTIKISYSKEEDYYDFIVEKNGVHISDFNYRSEAFAFAKKYPIGCISI